MSRRTRIRVLAEAIQPIVPDVDAVKRAVRAMMTTGANAAKALWIRRAQELDIRESGAYIAGIQDATVELVEDTDTGDTLGTVFQITNRAPHAGIVENGHAAFSLPAVINWSSNSGSIKRGKNGPYLMIPFRHAAFQSAEKRDQSGMTRGTLKTMMPEDIYARAKNLQAQIPQKVGPIFRSGGQIVTGEQHRGQAQFLAADRYAKGADPNRRRLSDARMHGFAVGTDGQAYEVRRGSREVGRDAKGKRLSNPAWQSSRFEGLMKTGPKGHTAYLTIRVVTPRSRGWNIPAKQGHGVARQVAGALNHGVGAQRFQELLVKAARTALGTG